MDNPQTFEEQIDRIIGLALAEDVGQGDVTSEVLIPPELQGKAYILVKAEGVLAGGEVAKELFLKVDPSINFEILIKDGEKIKPGNIIATISGKVISIVLL